MVSPPDVQEMLPIANSLRPKSYNQLAIFFPPFNFYATMALHFTHLSTITSEQLMMGYEPQPFDPPQGLGVL
jgi:hypothetical protein